MGSIKRLGPLILNSSHLSLSAAPAPLGKTFRLQNISGTLRRQGIKKSSSGLLVPSSLKETGGMENLKL